MRLTFTRAALAAILLVAPLSLGCVDSTPYKTDKPVVDQPETDTDEELESKLNELGDEIKERAEDATDAVTPDDPIVDVDTGLGDVNVSKDPITGETNVDVDTDGDDN